VRLGPHEAERRFAELLADAGLPRFAFSSHDPAVDELKLTWAHGLTIHVDLTRGLSPIDDWERAAILGQAPGYSEPESFHVRRLVETGILRQTTVGRRNRAFEATELIDSFTALERQLASPEGDTHLSPPARRAPYRTS
jgi:hypothetical protein